MTVAAAAAAWLGGSVVLLSSGRRGLALGLVILTAGLAALLLLGGHYVGAGAILAGGLLAAALRVRAGPGGWGVMPAGSTPNLILSIAIGLIVLWLATAVAGGPDAGLRFAIPAATAVLVVRLLLGADAAAASAVASGLALVLGAGTAAALHQEPDSACLVAGIVAAGIQALPRPETDGA